MMVNAKDEYEQCMKDIGEKKGLQGYDAGRIKCIGEYKNELRKEVPNLNQIYEGYQRNF